MNDEDLPDYIRECEGLLDGRVSASMTATLRFLKKAPSQVAQ